MQGLQAYLVALYLSYRISVCRYENKLVVAVGKGEPASVMSEYGFK